MLDDDTGKDYLTIGDLSRLTGLSTHNLRVWEKRHGAPKAARLQSGHRRYPKSEVPRLRAIAKALDSGFRASKVVSATLEELHKLLGLSSGHLNFTNDKENLEIKEWLEEIKNYNEDKLNYRFHELWGQYGAMEFITDYVCPFVEEVGNDWETGILEISQEHFATQCIGNFLSKKWRQLNQRNDGPTAILSTLPGEMHELG